MKLFLKRENQNRPNWRGKLSWVSHLSNEGEVAGLPLDSWRTVFFRASKNVPVYTPHFNSSKPEWHLVTDKASVRHTMEG